jgi:hypothetical protein
MYHQIGGVRSGDDSTTLALIADDVLFAHQIFCIIQPFFFPILLSEVLELEAWMKD